jgi:hypothetical protein
MAIRNISTRAIPVLEDTSEDHSDEEDSNGDAEAPDTSSTKDSDSAGEQGHVKESEKQDEIAAEESVGVSRWRRMVVLMLCRQQPWLSLSTTCSLSRRNGRVREVGKFFIGSVATQPKQASDQNHIMQH